ncbi:hypothetical protein B0H11DRAFT_1937423 [Mycena galericulata]|nr:hypothetical protein B0H11DRAFT_1937423 [Mycena galericulata]
MVMNGHAWSCMSMHEHRWGIYDHPWSSVDGISSAMRDELLDLMSLPNPRLPRRGGCATCSDKCGGFSCEISGEYREVPDHPTTLCFCSHPYFSHRLYPSSPVGKTPTPVINTVNTVQQPPAAFPLFVASSSSSLPPMANTNPFSGTASLAPPLPAQTVAGPSGAAQPTPALPVHTASNPFAPARTLPPPAAAFSQLLRPTISTWDEAVDAPAIQVQRTSSIARMHAQNGSSPRRRRGLVGEHPDAPIAGPSGPSSSSTLIPRLKPGEHVYFLCILPFMLGKHQYDLETSLTAYSFKTHDELPTLLPALTLHNLTTSLVLHNNNVVPLWNAFDTHIHTHLAANKIILSPAPNCTGSGRGDHGERAWDLAVVRSNNKLHKRSLSPAAMYEHQWTHANIAIHAKKHDHPETSTFRLLFIGPLSAIDNTAHACFPWRVFWNTQLCDIEHDEFDDLPACIDECPKPARRSALPQAEPPIKRNTAPSPEPEPLAKRPRLFDAPLDDYSPPTTDMLFQDLPSAKSRPNFIEIDDDSESEPDQRDSLVDELVAAAGESQTVVPLDYSAVLAWRTEVYNAIGSEDALSALVISGPSVASVAGYLFCLIKAMDKSVTVEEEVGLYLEPINSLAGFLHGGRVMRVYSDPEKPTSSGATGPGPEHSVYIQGLNIRLSHTRRWTKSQGMYFRPQLYPMTDVHREDVISEFKVDGTWAALYIVQVGMGPDPLCPFLLLAATQHDRQWLGDLSLSYIFSLDPSAAKILAPWFKLTPDQVFKFPDDINHPAMALVATYLNVPISDFTVARDPAAHRAMHIRILCQFFFSYPDPWQHPEFMAFVAGFDIRLKGAHTFLSHCTNIHTVKALIAALYNRRIKSVDEVIEKIEFEATRSADTAEKLRRELFQMLFFRWIRGIGFPRSIRGKFVTAAQYKAQRKNPLIRAESFLYSMTGNRAIPLNPEFRLTICLIRSDDQLGRTLGFHDCSATVDVPFNEATDNLLLEDVNIDELSTVHTGTEFDYWMSSEFSLDPGDYNDL